jgi:hypothetical protein
MCQHTASKLTRKFQRTIWSVLTLASTINLTGRLRMPSQNTWWHGKYNQPLMHPESNSLQWGTTDQVWRMLFSLHWVRSPAGLGCQATPCLANTMRVIIDLLRIRAKSLGSVNDCNEVALLVSTRWWPWGQVWQMYMRYYVFGDIFKDLTMSIILQRMLAVLFTLETSC